MTDCLYFSLPLNHRKTCSLIIVVFFKNVFRLVHNLFKLFMSVLSAMAIGIFICVIIDVTQNPRNIFWNICVNSWQSGMCTKDAPWNDTAGEYMRGKYFIIKNYSTFRMESFLYLPNKPTILLIRPWTKLWKMRK